MLRSARLAVCSLSILGVLAPLRTARAQAKPIEFPVQNFRPAISPKGWWVSENAKVLPDVSPSVQVMMSFVKRPLQLVNTDTKNKQSEIIKDRIDFDVLVGVALYERFELGIGLPVTASQSSGDGVLQLDRPAGTTLSGGFGDVRFVPKLRVITSEGGSTSFALSIPVTAPSGSDANLLGESGATATPTAILSVDTDVADVAFNAGFRVRSQDPVKFSQGQSNVAFGNEIVASAGPKFHLVKDRLDLIGDGWLSVSVDEQDPEEIPAEALGGLRYYLENGLVFNGGAGGGLTRGIGAPAFRMVLGIGWQYKLDPDPDHDGILRDADHCPFQPEDKDQFKDEDGCPDPDNDKDGILDPKDRCPLDPEDKDSWEDEDGCPDPDNDKDEILDPDDQCPDKAEDRDKFQDTDGCPDPDNDKDGILDKDDKCPMEPEDKDSWEDADGCPDPDNDKDGILDAADKCPNEPETVNGNEDQDGCPDQAKGPVQIEHGKITAPPVFFATDKDVILSQSFPILELIAQTFKDNPWVKKVRIEGHTDDKGSDDHNMKLSQRRTESVMKFLIDHGVDAERVEARGYGETRPIESNKSEKGRAKNRRVEFIIIDPPMEASGSKAGPE